MITRDFSGSGSFGTVIHMYMEKEVHKDGLDAFAEEVLDILKETDSSGAVVLALSGDLGAGKTTFTQALGRVLGITDDITSPTFTLMKGYETTDDVFSHLVHMDAYRIESEEELRPLRFGEMLKTPHTILVIEWAELIQGALPPKVLHLTLSIKDEATRNATLSWHTK